MRKQTSYREKKLAEVEALISFLKENPELPLPYYLADDWSVTVDDEAELMEARRMMGGTLEKVITGYSFGFKKSLGAFVSYSVNVPRDTVCEKVVTGKRVVAAVPAREAYEVEEYEYKCPESFLVKLGEATTASEGGGG